MSLIELSRRVLSAATPGAAGVLGRCLPVGLLAMAVVTPAVADIEYMEASGTGASTTVQSSHMVDDRRVSSFAEVFVSVPADPSTPAIVAVALTQTDEETGATLFAGQGVSAALDFVLDADMSGAHLQADLLVQSAADGSSRVLSLNLVWSAEDDTQHVAYREREVEQGNIYVSQHDGNVRRMATTGVVQVSNPDVEGHTFTITPPAAPGSVWDSTSSGSRRERRTRGGAEFNLFTETAATTTTTTGYWTGYWTWIWTGTSWVAKWTWVWKSSTGSWTVS